MDRTEDDQNLAQRMKHGISALHFRRCTFCEQKDLCEHRGVLKVNGLGRCKIESDIFDYTVKSFEEEYKINKVQQIKLYLVAYNILRSLRASQWIADNGLVKIQYVKDEKGKLFQNEVPNPLDKSLYFIDKSIREWFAELRKDTGSKAKIQPEDTFRNQDVAKLLENIKQVKEKKEQEQ